MTRASVASRVLLGELAPLDLLGQRLLERRHHGVGRLLLAGPQHHLVAGLGRHLGDARPHDPRTQDAHALDRHGRSSYRAVTSCAQPERLTRVGSPWPDIWRWSVAASSPRGARSTPALLEASGASEVLWCPPAAAYEHPQRLVERAVGLVRPPRRARPRGLDLLARPDAVEARGGRRAGGLAVHLPGGRFAAAPAPGPEGLAGVGRHRGGVAAAAACSPARRPGAMVLCDPMVDPRGGAFTLGLGLLPGVAVIPAHDHWSEDAAHRTRKMSPADAGAGRHRRAHRADPRPRRRVARRGRRRGRRLRRRRARRPVAPCRR